MFKQLKSVLKSVAAQRSAEQSPPRSGEGLASVMQRLVQDRLAGKAARKDDDPTLAPWSVLGPQDGDPTVRLNLRGRKNR